MNFAFNRFRTRRGQRRESDSGILTRCRLSELEIEEDFGLLMFEKQERYQDVMQQVFMKMRFYDDLLEKS